MPVPRSGITEIDHLRAAPFVDAVAPLFERAPGFLWRLAAARGGPFGSWDGLFARARAVAHEMPEPLQVDLVDAHPRLGARRDRLSAMSAREQGVADLGDAADLADAAGQRTADETTATLRRLNADYEARFGFRYCVCVAGRPLAALVPAFEAALGADRPAELHRALDAVVDIARARHDVSAERVAGADAGRPAS
ncbi:MAG TPA: 2-oxo-4-hydroxy-4-carboxy-5-ureidoimidazoline decarboxylase [Candidatus Limnocylindrales bacterium]|nr:2-oxo-4-hydroxy-4-carboxy-5-ureidoimidazoline decarboxylase [Candidatus Limnocylindrales bacterium]